jgi:ring-1,2-phenylacetyl-CoA epoxidase subunit PaaE
MSLQRVTIHSIVQETADTKSFILQPATGAIPYQPGQFLTLLHPRKPSVRRSYSLSSHPSLDTLMKITVKRISNGEFSRWLFDEAKVGDVLETIGAAGFFTLPASMQQESVVLLLAAGSGITPVVSLLREILFHRSQQVVLVYSSHSEKDAIFYKELKALAAQFSSRFTLIFLHSNSKDLYRARLNKYLLAELIHQYLPTKTNALAYVCGPHDYMQMARITLLTEGVPAGNIHIEQFNTDKPVAKELPPDTESHRVAIEYHGQKWEMDVKYPDTILKTAQQRGIDLPYSCESGRCGTCAATCVEGKVWMSRNEVLMEKEMEKGRVLTCTGYPVGGDVKLVIREA